ncbi:hypothetical protein D7S86_08995 [Pararobbsia silviterrae]|uniref:Uncharacterized protein n=1 Tax=Pararobbsia silviterrae TaxID=1792498 RepID=A0A494Y143_9BURK|nr:hypothetical protein D7S86_08995 [Pararobbsia silviterrae]
MRPHDAARCPLPAARCPLPAARCPLPAARCVRVATSFPNTRTPEPEARSPKLKAQGPRPKAQGSKRLDDASPKMPVARRPPTPRSGRFLQTSNKPQIASLLRGSVRPRPATLILPESGIRASRGAGRAGVSERHDVLARPSVRNGPGCIRRNSIQRENVQWRCP